MSASDPFRSFTIETFAAEIDSQPVSGLNCINASTWRYYSSVMAFNWMQHFALWCLCSKISFIDDHELYLLSGCAAGRGSVSVFEHSSGFQCFSAEESDLCCSEDHFNWKQHRISASFWTNSLWMETEPWHKEHVWKIKRSVYYLLISPFWPYFLRILSLWK